MDRSIKTDIQKDIAGDAETWRLWIWKKKSIFNLISHQPDIDKIYLYVKDPYEAKY